jgi:hypothetical protein
MKPQRAQPQRVTTGSRRWTRRQAEVRGHIIVLEQATMAVLEGYMGSPLYHRAAHAAQQLLALAETMAWREGTRVAYEMVHLFHTTAIFGFVHAMHLSELTAAFYREMAQAAAGPTPAHGRTAIREAHLHTALGHTGAG